MPSFSYVVKDRKGKRFQGTLEAANQAEAAGKLRQENYLILQLTPANQRSLKLVRMSENNANSVAVRGKVKLKEKIFFTKQFSVMLKAGMGMLMCLNNLYEQTQNKYFRYIINQTRYEVESGVTLSVALSKFPKVFDKMFVHLLEAGEASGKLDVSLARLTEYYEREYNLKKKIVGALVYPAIIMCVAVAVVAILVVFVLPTFAQMFADSNVELPGITKALLAVSNFCRTFWYLIPLLIVGFVFGYRQMAIHPEGRKLLDNFWLKVPVLGELLRNLVTSRFSRTFATLLDSGVPLLQSLEIVERAVNNGVIAKGIEEARLNVKQGTGLAQPLQESGIFPVMVSQMVAIGEETGDLSHMLTEVADYYDKEVEYSLENVTAMIEPLIIVGLGGVVAFIVAAIMLPMFDISSGATLR